MSLFINLNFIIMGWFDDLLGYIPGVGSAVDLLGGVFGFDDTSRSIRSNEKIANMNMKAVSATNKQNWINNKETNESNQKIAQMYNANQVQLQNDMNNFNQRMWQINNDYNSPSRQLARAADAGINPNVVFGQPVAASPVQQTSVPNQQMSEMRPYNAQAPQNDMRYNYKTLEKIGAALNGLSKLPFVREQLEGIKEDNRSKKLDNELKEYEKWERKIENERFNNFGVFRSRNGRVVTPDEFERLSQAEKNEFLDVKHYRHKISGKTLSPEDYKIQVPESDSNLWSPEYSSELPKFEKSMFKTKRDYENYMSLYAFGNTLTNIDADSLQNIIRHKVYSGQLAHTEVTNAMIHMPDATFDKLVQDCLKVKQDVARQLAENENLRERLKNRDRIDEYTANRMERDAEINAVNIIKQYVPEGKMQSFFISLYAILKEINSFR